MARRVSLDILDRVVVASPCHARWEDMKGDERQRFCDECRLNVYNLSAMTRQEAVDLVTRAEGRLCAGFWRRADGTILTRDCPVGIAAARARATAALRRVAAALALVIGAGVTLGLGRGTATRLRQAEPFATVCRWLNPPPPPPPPAPALLTRTAGVIAFERVSPPAPPKVAPAPQHRPKHPASKSNGRSR
jgi:hypothetical protein